MLDIGCGDGALLSYLSEFKQVDARGIELSMAGVNECVSDGLSVIQGDADTDLDDYPDGAFDYAVLEPDAPGDPAAAPRGREPRAHRPARDPVAAQFRPLARAAGAAADRPHAADRDPALSLV